MKKKRVFVIVLDSLGIGALPDAAQYFDEGSNTLASVAQQKEFCAPFLTKLGLFNIDGVNCAPPCRQPLANYARLAEKSKGKDTTTGHWEMTGIISQTPFPTYPHGFDEEIIERFKQLTGRGVLCNKPYSGTQVIKDYGIKHLETGSLIVYTSADSVFQVAAHTSVVELQTLYGYCEAARKMLQGKHAVGRVIARPFEGEHPFKRTADRKDYALPPPRNLLNELKESGLDVISVGKINDIFCGSGITESYPTHGNDQGQEQTLKLCGEDFHGLCFVNLVDFDMLYGHRNDARGYASALSETDSFLQRLFDKLGEEDALIVCADHGCDPSDESTDHTREYVPFLLCGDGFYGRNLGTIQGLDFVGKTAKELLLGAEEKS